MGGDPRSVSEHSSPLLLDPRSQLERPSPRAQLPPPSPGGRSVGSFTYRLPTFPRNVSICQLAGGASEEETVAHKRIQRKLLIALCLAFIFMLVEVAGGIYAHSLAIITDAAHLLSDVSGFAVAALAAYYAKRKSMEHFSYGYHRVEVLGALASVMTVWLVTGLLLFEAVQRIITPEKVNGKVMFIIALVGVGVNVLMLLVLGHHHHGPGGHSHGHGGHSHSHEPLQQHDHGEHGHSHSHGHGHSHDEEQGCGGSGKPSAAKRGLAPSLAVAAELSRSSSRAEGEGGGCGHNHKHGHSHGHKHGHSHSHKHAAAAAAAGDLEAGSGQAAAEHHHSHSHHSHSDEEAGRSSDEEGVAGRDSNGRTPILAAAGHAHRSSNSRHHHEHAHGHSHAQSHGHAHGHQHGPGCSHSHGPAAATGPLAPAAAPKAAAHGHGGGGCSHDHANMNVRGAIIHVIGDFVQSIGVAIAGALIWWHQDDPRWYIADPICTFLFALLVLWTTRAILRDIADVLMERVPRGLCINTINDDFSRVPGVEEIHDLHVWSLTPGIPLLCAHVNLAPDADPTAVLHALTTYCRGIGVDHSTIQLVSDGSACPCGPC